MSQDAFAHKLCPINCLQPEYFTEIRNSCIIQIYNYVSRRRSSTWKYDFLFGFKAGEQNQSPREQHWTMPGSSGASPQLPAHPGWWGHGDLPKPPPPQHHWGPGQFQTVPSPWKNWRPPRFSTLNRSLVLGEKKERKIKGLLFVSNEFQKKSYEKPFNRNRKQALLRTGETMGYNSNTSFSTVAVTSYKKPITKSPH